MPLKTKRCNGCPLRIRADGPSLCYLCRVTSVRIAEAHASPPLRTVAEETELRERRLRKTIHLED